MAKIVFWSPLHGQGQTSNLHIIGLIMSLLYNKRTLMMQTHFSMNNLEGPLIGKTVDFNSTQNGGVFQDIGLDAAVMYSGMNGLTENVLESCCITFPDTSLLLLPGTEAKNRETFDRDISSMISRMIRHAENHVDIIMIDANSGKDELSFELMSSADLVIINLTQGQHILHRFFLENEEVIKNQNLFFLFGNYDKNSGYNIVNCRRKYNKHIQKYNSGVIPYCTKYMDAQNDSNILSMVREGIHSYKITEMNRVRDMKKSIYGLRKYSVKETDYFLRQACRSTAKIINMINTKNINTLVERGGI